MRNFFVSIDREILCKLLLKNEKCPVLRRLIHTVYQHDARVGARKTNPPAIYSLIPPGKSWFDQGPGQGIPIGNLTSQFGANVYLTALDHFVQRKLKPAAYLRYMDDLLLLDHDPEKLNEMISPVDQWLHTHRKQKLNPSKTILTDLSKGIRYLGYELVLDSHCSSEPLQLFAEPLKKWKFIQAVRKMEYKQYSAPSKPHPFAPTPQNSEQMRNLSSINSRIGTLIHSKTYRFRKKVMDRFLKNSTELGELPPELAHHWTPYVIKKGYRSIKIR